VKVIARFLWKTVKWTFIVFCVYLGSLFFRDQRIPAEWVVSAVGSHVPSNVVFKCDSASFGFRHGVRMHGIRVYDSARENPLEAVLSADDVSVDFLARRVRAVGLRFPRLHDAYYRPGNLERNERVDVELPRVPSFMLTLVRPEILGVAPERVRAVVTITPRRLELSGLRLWWPDMDRPMSLDGFSYVDFDEQRVHGEARGEARQAHFRPLLVALDIPAALPYMDAFTGVSEPVPVVGKWDVNLVNGDFLMNIELHPVLGRYNGVPMRRVDGSIGLHVYTRGTNLNYNTSIGPLVAVDPKGRALEGRLLVSGTNDVVRLDFDTKSAIELKSLLGIADCLNDGTLDCVRCETPPEVTVRGSLSPDPARPEGNDLSGSVSFAKGSFFSMPAEDVSFDYAYRGREVAFDDIRLKGRDGGRYSGRAAIRLPAEGGGDPLFELSVEGRNGSLAELAGAIGVDFGNRRGSAEGKVDLSGPISTNLYPRLNGKGTIRLADECLAQMRLFMGLTDYLAKNVPGVAGLVNQSEASADYTIENGVLRSDNILIEGDIFSIKAWGAYDMTADDLDFTVRVQLLRNDSFLGKLVHPVTFPFTKMLLEFRVSGSVDDPHWKYISVLDRIL